MIWMPYKTLFLILFLLFTPPLYFVFHGATLTKTVNDVTTEITLTKGQAFLFSLVFGGVASISIGAIIAALGIVESPSKRLYPEIPPVSREELEKRLLSLNHPDRPWEIVRGDDCDFIARWKLVDAKWWEIMARAGLKMQYRGLILLDEEKKQVRYFEEMSELEWTVGLRPKVLSVRKSYFGGRIFFSKRKAAAYGIKQLKPFEIGEIYKFSFDVNEIRGPIIEVVERAGWNFQPVTARRHATK